MARTSSLYKLPSAELESLRGWNKLEPQEQSAVHAEYKAISAALHSEGQSRLAAGKHLLAAQEILSPKRLFDAFIRRHFHLSRSSAFNYIALYRAAMKDAPKKVIDIAMSRNYKAINRPEVFKHYPPPKTNDTAKIIQYLDRLETRKPKIVSIHKNAEGLMKQALHAVELCYQQLPNNQKTRNVWVESLIGMQITKFGVDADQHFSPVDIPESFTVERGRPRKKAA